MRVSSSSFRLPPWAGVASTVAIGVVLMFAVPRALDLYAVVQFTGFAALAMYGLSQGFLWGHAGILSFGQAAFLGLGGYSYAVAVINLGDSTPAVALAIFVPAFFALLLGYFMFYGRVSDAYVGVVTLTVSIIIFQLVNSTSGSQYRIGDAELGGFNGIPAIPALNLPGDHGNQLDTEWIWYIAIGALILVYVMLRGLLASSFGRVLVAIRENNTRAQLLGYDTRLYKLIAFVISAGVAGLAGCLYANWSGFISPPVFALQMSAQVIIFVLIGGVGTLVGPMIGAIIVQSLLIVGGTQQTVDPNLGLGVVLIGFVLLVPQGLLPTSRRIVDQLLERSRSNSKMQNSPSGNALDKVAGEIKL